jgi:cytochrome c oxidase assembly protein subunit 15
MTPSAPPVARDRPPARGLFRFAVLFTAVVLVHIKGGALVTSTGSGMAFTDWPLARGSLWPPGMDLEDLFEHLHRIVGAVVGLLAVTLAVWVTRADRRAWLARTVWVLLAMIVVQGVLGGLGVRLGREGGTTWAPAAVAHGVLAQPTLCLSAFVAFALSPGFDSFLRVPADWARTARRLSGVALAAVFVQVGIGAVVRHTDAQGLLWLHVFLALFVSLAIVVAAAYCAGRFSSHSPGFRTLCTWIWIVLLSQLVLGFLTLVLRRPKDPSNIDYLGRGVVVSLHVVFGAVLFLLATLLFARTLRTLVPAPRTAPSGHAAEAAA